MQIGIELLEEQARAVEHAAALEGISVHDFIKLSTVKEAHNVIDRYHITHVTLEHGKAMMKALDEAE